jgi:hypothetical protein
MVVAIAVIAAAVAVVHIAVVAGTTTLNNKALAAITAEYCYIIYTLVSGVQELQ